MKVYVIKRDDGQGCSKAIHDYYITKAREMIENE